MTGMLRTRSVPGLMSLGTNFPKEDNHKKKMTLGYRIDGPIDKLKNANAASEKALRVADILKKEGSWRWTSDVERPPRDVKMDTTARNQRLPRLAPAWLKHTNQVLRFYAYFQETVTERLDENCRYRNVVICYYMEDGTMSVGEPKIENSGIPQGPFLKRQQVIHPERGGFIGPGDLRVGESVTFNGVTFHIVGCDRFTRWFYEENGIELEPDESLPKDQWAKSYTFQKVAEKGGLPVSRSAQEAKVLTMYQIGQPPADKKFIQFLQNDRKVLRFKAYWDDPTLYGNRIYFTVHYYLSNNTVEINEAHARNSGRDKYPVFYKRGPLYKEDRINAYPGMLEPDKVPYEPQDLIVGQSFNVWGRKLILYECDDFTQQFYEEHMGIHQNASRIDVSEKPKKHVKLLPPPHNGIGKPEDSLMNCLMVQPKAAKQDLARLMTLSGEVLRFETRLLNGEPEDENRQFVVAYYPADEHVAVFELQVRNSGHMAGKFAEKKRTVNPRSGKYFELQDFAIGSVVVLAAQPMLITRADEHTLQFLEREPNLYPFADPFHCAELLRPIASLPQMQGDLDPDELKNLAGQNGVHLIDHEIITLLRHFNSAEDGGQPMISGSKILETLGGAA
eukprot:TRINITY_DN1169_c0_g2_i1.p1 TRINITY_DN1169_c0_g2~~TRINITY_DN1169_c0_g2_i1.p1  ORF type:complete len:619 (+),score=97.28 TRINITY_DN1169_c0_g2_i1:138-1994(+)